MKTAITNALGGLQFPTMWAGTLRTDVERFLKGRNEMHVISLDWPEGAKCRSSNDAAESIFLFMERV